ncbi:MAG: anthranilate phosphoribosyltransferase [Candidatus Omnitrophica bacterium]|nr:anthranilate phosphoribosyltransferase [Candidatus Omnitrophota bacterium]
MRNYIEKINSSRNLTHEEITVVMELIVSGHASSDDISDFLLALNSKGPTVEEITACALIMRKFVVPIKTRHEVVLDTCGTGGDHKGTFNISTVAAFVIASCGIAVAKNGNRSVSSQCGSADVLEALGINVNLDERLVGQCLDKVGIAFLFAQRLHPAMKNVAPIRKALGVKTIFNVLGPLTNPACATHQIVGVYSRDLVEPLAQVLMNLGLKRALVVHGDDGLDEITTTDRTFIAESNGRDVVSYDIDAQELGVPRAMGEDLKGGDKFFNAAILENILKSHKGPKRDIVLVNAAYGLYTAGAVENISQGFKMAEHALDSGRAYQKLEELKEFTSRV